MLQYTGRKETEFPGAHLGVAQLVARYLGVVEAASSSLVTQTKKALETLRFPMLFSYPVTQFFGDCYTNCYADCVILCRSQKNKRPLAEESFVSKYTYHQCVLWRNL